ncbi:MAG: glucosaminidase domain-containing protein [Actinomycetaceae bacterium]|nr:glucosaminidase domain-containing protein [Actinomycetaceae bacterium]
MKTRTKARLASVSALICALMCGLAWAQPLPAYADDVVNMHRLYNRISHEHLYTADMNEVNALMRGDWTYEGVGWVAPKDSSTPVYRLYNPGLGDHHYTSDANEVSVLTSRCGWKDEGIGWYSDTEKRITVYRQYNPGFSTGAHNYTADRREYDVNNARNGWRGEGVAWYAAKAGWSSETNAVSVTYANLAISLDEMTKYQFSNPYYSSFAQSDIRAHLNPKKVAPTSAEYYQFVDLRSYTGMSAKDINAFISSTETGRSGNLVGLGHFFVQASQKYKINEAYLVAHAVLESGWGTSQLAQGYYYDGKTPIRGKLYPAGTYYNYFGIGAVDSDALGAGRATAIANGWDSREKAIVGGAEWISRYYIYGASANGYDQSTLYAMKWDYKRSSDTHARGWHQYATDISWAEKIARNMKAAYSHASNLPQVSYVIPRYR